jgi:hypothetical protein
MSMLDPTTTVRGRDEGETAVFRLHCEWSAGTGTSVHKHAGWELVLITRGELRYVLDGRPGVAASGRYLELPAGSVHGIWADDETAFDVVGQQGLGLTIVVPNGGGGTREVPIYGATGPWAQEPPAGVPYTLPEELELLRRASLALRPAPGAGRP